MARGDPAKPAQQSVNDDPRLLEQPGVRSEWHSLLTSTQ